MEIKVHMVVEKLQNIKEIDMTFDAKFTLTMEWFDSRLKYKNLQNSRFTNLVNEENKAKVWIPNLVFNNTGKDVMVTNEPKAILFIDKQGHRTQDHLSLTPINEDFYYEGSENMLVLKIGYELTFQCEFQLQGYPFDTQTCMIEVSHILYQYVLFVLIINIVDINTLYLDDTTLFIYVLRLGLQWQWRDL